LPSPVLSLLKYVFLAFLYLFFLRVLRAVWTELREPKVIETPPFAREAGADLSPPVAPHHLSPDAGALTSMAPAMPGGGQETVASQRVGGGGRLIVTAPPGLAGTAFPLSDELTIGRSPGCGVSIPDDTFVSSVHARVFLRSGDYHLEDLGSTNGTFLNDTKVGAAVRLRPGDSVRVGQTVLELVT
jgi:hypothetical protein